MTKILIASKQSKYEYERDKFKLTHEEILRKYSGEKANVRAILQSHEALVRLRGELVRKLPEAQTKLWYDLEKGEAADLVIALGGDNHFTYVTHHVDSALLMGLNSDPGRSTGALCLWSSQNLDEVVSRIKQQEYRIQQWPRLKAAVDGKPIATAASEYFFGEKERKQMTRHVLVFRGKEYEQKSSGIIISTGAGSTGWYKSAGRYLYPFGNIFPRTSDKARFLITEPFKYADSIPERMLALVAFILPAGYLLLRNFGKRKGWAGEFRKDEEIEIHSLNDAEGIASSDSWEEYEFRRGSKAIVRLGKPLSVVVP